MISNRLKIISTGLIASLSTTSVYAAGFEKAILWSGKFAGTGGAATSWVSGPESLFFNPAGLAAGQSLQASVNFSPTFAKFSGPFSSSTQVDGKSTFSPVTGDIVSYKLTDQLGVGLGFFVSGGTHSSFEGIDFGTPFTLKPNSKADIKVTELSAGAGYELIEGLRIGGAYRVTFVQADIISAQRGLLPAGSPAGTGGQPIALTEISLTDLSDTRYNGFRFGLQYAPKDAGYGFGANLRTPITFLAKGNSSARVQGNTAVGPGGAVSAGAGVTTSSERTLTGSAAELQSTLPLQISVGAFMDTLDKKLRVIPEYTFTRYGVDDVADVSATINNATGSIPTNSLSGGNLSVPDFQQGWRNQHNARLGLQYMVMDDFALRGGYVWTSKVTPPERARPTFAPPGVGHSFTLGAGTSFLESKLGVDGAFEYSTNSGAGTNPEGVAGEFSAKGYVVHVGLNYTL